jgi:hypothetical protein
MTRWRWLLGALLAAAGCAAAQAQFVRPTGSACGARCDAMVCPQGSVCTVDSSCTPSCVVQSNRGYP